MTLSYGANDIFEVLGTIFSKPKYNTILSDIQDSKKRNAGLKGLSNSIIDILDNQIIKASAIANNVSFLNSYDKKY